jgi:hypothetical protein
MVEIGLIVTLLPLLTAVTKSMNPAGFVWPVFFFSFSLE